MAIVNTTSIVVGAGKLFAGPNKTTVDADITTNGDNSTYYVGSTQEGIMIGWEPDMVDIEVDQFGDAARIVQNKQKVNIKTTMAEATLFNLALAWGYDTGVGATEPGLRSGYALDGQGKSTGTFNVGIHSVYPTERYVRVEGNGPGSNATTTVYRTYRNNRCVQYSASEFALNRSENVKFTVEFRALPDSSQTGAEYGTIVDQTTVPYTNYVKI